ncbi:MAG: sulfatase-like hydrolase/transferase [Verrucomicrobia bacterium]|nr:sulfatase-like hydrolase/transferase [Verrucomicrobiota bacterium]
MKRLKTLFAIGLCLLVHAGAFAADAPRPNIVFIISDDHAWTDYGFMGHKQIETPNLDRLALRSALFSRAYVPTALAAAGVGIPKNLPGYNLLPILKSGQPTPRQIVFGETFAHDVANIDRPEDSLLYRWAIEGKWKLLLTYDGKLGRYASSHPRTEKRPQLFDLLADPHEDHNLAAENSEVVARLAAKLQEWWPVTERQVITKWTDEPGQWR